MKIKNIILFFFLFFCPMLVCAQNQMENTETTFDQAADAFQQKLQKSINELKKLRERVASETIPLSKELSDLESELIEVRNEYQQTSRLLDTRTLDLSNLQSEIKSRKQEATYLSNLLSEYIRNFESRLHIAEIHRYEEPLEAAQLATENSSLSQKEVYEAQAQLMMVSLERLHDALGGTKFKGTAVDESGLVENGTFMLMGPVAVFRSEDGQDIGTVEQILGSLEPAIVKFGLPEDELAAAKLISDSSGLFPLDPTLGNAHKIEQTRETFLEHVKKGGPVMYPIFVLAGTSLLVALFKWMSLAFLRKPTDKKINSLLQAVARGDETAAKEQTAAINRFQPRLTRDWILGALSGAMIGAALNFVVRLDLLPSFASYVEFPYSLWVFAILGSVIGAFLEFILRRIFSSSPVGKMLKAGVEHIKEPRELIEEVMYEKVLSTRLKLQRFLPFIAISAASAPLLGLLGTVTGIINTFKLITVFGSGDVKTLSGGISEALITTEFGLIVAIPSLLLHAFLSRRARRVVNEMEKAAVSFVNQVSKTQSKETKHSDVLSKMTAGQIQDLLQSINSKPQPENLEPIMQYSKDSAGGLMNQRLVSVEKNATVADAINRIRAAGIGEHEEIDTVFVVDERGKYIGHVLIRNLVTRPEQAQVESLADKTPLFVRVDTHQNEVKDLFSKHNLVSIPVLDHNDQLVGRVTRNGNGDVK